MTAYAYLDIHTRHVSNFAVLGGAVLALIVGLLSGHMQVHPLLHFSAIVFVPGLSYVLFRIGAFGGADVKVLSVVALVSPGFELSELANPLFESVLSAGIQMLIMLLGGYLYMQYLRDRNQAVHSPLIPFLLLGYLAVQLLAFV